MLKMISYDEKNYYCVDGELRNQLTSEEKKDLRYIIIKLPFSAKNFITVEDYEKLIDGEEEDTIELVEVVETIEEEEVVEEVEVETIEVNTEAEEVETIEEEVETIEINTEAEEVERIYVEEVDMNFDQMMDYSEMYASDEFQKFKEECKQYTDAETLELDLATKGYKIFSVNNYVREYFEEKKDLTVVIYNEDVYLEMTEKIKESLRNKGIDADESFYDYSRYGICLIEMSRLFGKVRVNYGQTLEDALNRTYLLKH